MSTWLSSKVCDWLCCTFLFSTLLSTSHLFVAIIEWLEKGMFIVFLTNTSLLETSSSMTKTGLDWPVKTKTKSKYNSYHYIKLYILAMAPRKFDKINYINKLCKRLCAQLQQKMLFNSMFYRPLHLSSCSQGDNISSL